MTAKTVIFDLGGVLVDVDFMRACRQFEAMGGIPATELCARVATGADKRALDTGSIEPQAFGARISAICGLEISHVRFAEIWCDIFTEKSEVTALLPAIGEKADLMLLSNTDPMHVDYVRRNFAFLPRFRQLILSYEVGHAKPAAEIFKRALALARPGSELLYFDDVPEFVAAARGCGIVAEQFVDAPKLRRDLVQFGVL